MRETEAAAYLQVTPRTLQRYRQRGQLAYREVKGPTRPVIEYEVSDLDVLKARWEAQRQRAAQLGPTRPRAAPRVTFGLPPEGYAELAAEAARYDLSVGDYARRLVRERLESRYHSEAAELRSQVQRLETELERMRRDFAGGFEALLEFTGLSAEDAKQWVTDNLR